jgi:membrane AbrB-like protein
MNEKLLRFAACLISALLGGGIFVLLHMPLPWLLGPIAATMIGSNLLKLKFYCPVFIRNTGLLLIGYSMGASFTGNVLTLIAAQLPWMLLMTVMTLLFCFFLAYVNSKIAKIDYLTILTGSMPGAFSQMINLGEEIEGINLTVVTFFHVIRLLMIVLIIPLMVFSPLFNTGNVLISGDLVFLQEWQWENLFPNALIFTVVTVLCALLGKKIRLPTPYLLGPVIGTAALCLIGVQSFSLPPLMINVSQFCVGCYIGLLLKPQQMTNMSKVVACAIINGLFLILFSWALSQILVLLHGIPAETSFLCLAPGGMDQMGIIAHEKGAILSLVTCYQFFRSFFILFFMPPLLKLLWKYKHPLPSETGPLSNNED